MFHENMLEDNVRRNLLASLGAWHSGIFRTGNDSMRAQEAKEAWKFIAGFVWVNKKIKTCEQLKNVLADCSKQGGRESFEFEAYALFEQKYYSLAGSEDTFGICDKMISEENFEEASQFYISKRSPSVIVMPKFEVEKKKTVSPKPSTSARSTEETTTTTRSSASSIYEEEKTPLISSSRLSASAAELKNDADTSSSKTETSFGFGATIAKAVTSIYGGIASFFGSIAAYRRDMQRNKLFPMLCNIRDSYKGQEAENEGVREALNLISFIFGYVTEHKDINTPSQLRDMLSKEFQQEDNSSWESRAFKYVNDNYTSIDLCYRNASAEKLQDDGYSTKAIYFYRMHSHPNETSSMSGHLQPTHSARCSSTLNASAASEKDSESVAEEGLASSASAPKVVEKAKKPQVADTNKASCCFSCWGGLFSMFARLSHGAKSSIAPVASTSGSQDPEEVAAIATSSKVN